MSFLSPITGLVAGVIGVGFVLLMYMLKLRRRPVQVSSTMLWSKSVRDLEGNIPWQRLSPTMLLLLHLLIVLLLASALARPVRDGSVGTDDRVYLVIDTSASMGARAGTEPMIERAKRLAIEQAELLFDSGRSPRVSVVSAGYEPRVVLSDSSQRGQVIAAIRSIEPHDQPGKLIDTIALIERLEERDTAGESVSDESQGDEETSPVRPGRVVVYAWSDEDFPAGHTIAMRGGGGIVDPVVEPDEIRPNVGITAIGLQRDRVDPDLCRLFLRVEAGPSSARAFVARVFVDQQQIASSPMALEGEEQTLVTHTFEFSLPSAALLRVELDLDDALLTDNRAWVTVPGPEPIRVTLVAPGSQPDPLLVDILEVISRASVRVIGPDDPIGDASLVVYDRVSPRGVVGVPTIGFGVGFGAGYGTDDRVLEEQDQLRRAISWDRSSELLRDSGIGSVRYRRGVVFDEQTPGADALVVDQDGALVIERRVGSERHLRIGFALHDSDWAVQVGLTVFLVNAIEHLLPGSGGRGEVWTTRDTFSMRSADGEETSVGPFARVGVYELPDDRRVGVGLLDRSETRLVSGQPVRIGDGAAAVGQGRRGGLGASSLWRWFVGAAIVLLLLEWFAYLRKVRL